MNAVAIQICLVLLGAPPADTLKALEGEFDVFLALDLDTETKGLPRRLENMMGAIRNLEKSCAKVIAGRDPRASVWVHTRLGEAYVHLHRSLMAFPPPEGLDPEQKKIFQREIERMGDPFTEKATENLRRALSLARENDVTDPAVDAAKQLLAVLDARSAQAAKDAPPPTGADLMKLVLAEGPKLEACAGVQATRGDPGLQGRAEFKVHVAPTGYVTHVVVATKAFEGSDFARCVQDVIRRIRLNPFAGKGVVLDAALTYKAE